MFVHIKLTGTSDFIIKWGCVMYSPKGEVIIQMRNGGKQKMRPKRAGNQLISIFCEGLLGEASFRVLTKHEDTLTPSEAQDLILKNSKDNI